MFFTQLGRVAAGLAFVIFVSACAVNGPPSPVGPRVIVLERVKSVEGVKGVESVEISEDEAQLYLFYKV